MKRLQKKKKGNCADKRSSPIFKLEAIKVQTAYCICYTRISGNHDGDNLKEVELGEGKTLNIDYIPFCSV